MRNPIQFCLVIFSFTCLGLSAGEAHAKKSRPEVQRSPAQISPMGQAEAMARGLKESSPGFMRSAPANLGVVGVCQTAYGAYRVSSQDWRGYESCMDSRGHRTSAAAIFVIPR